MLAGMSDGGDPALIGRTIAGKFVVERYLGGGAMAAVYRARQAVLDKHVALKVMHPAVAGSPSYVARFHREAKAASRLDHPNSVRVIDFGEEPDGLLYIAMEYLDGRDLYRVIHEDWPLSNERIAELLMQALAAMAAAHDAGIVHRDLKPENIMVLRSKDDEDRDVDLVKVCDFGIAKMADGGDDRGAAQKLTTQGLVVGTPEYMSPEQARGEPLDARSDLYAMGVILYQLLTGRVPFTDPSPVAVVLKHISALPEPPRAIYPGVHEALEAVCLRALAKAREERFQSAREMRAAIRAAIEGRPAADAPVQEARPAVSSSSVAPGPDVAQPAASDSISKATPLGTESAARPPSRGRALPVVVVAVLAGLVAALGVRALRAPGEPPASSAAAAPTSAETAASAGSSALAAPPQATLPREPPVPEGASSSPSPPTDAGGEEDASAAPSTRKRAPARGAARPPAATSSSVPSDPAPP